MYNTVIGGNKKRHENIIGGNKKRPASFTIGNKKDRKVLLEAIKNERITGGNKNETYEHIL